MHRLAALAALAAALVPCPLQAQTEENLRRAIELYENLQVERARDLFLQVISPSSPFEVTNVQRVTAYKYLGATLASLDERDSALVYFRAAIERDPFTDLDPQVFAALERQAFAQAKQLTFRVGIRPLTETRLDPRTGRVSFSVVTTHSGSLILEVVSADGEVRFPIFQGENDGPRDIPWTGTLPRGGLAPAGSYDLLITGQSGLDPARTDSTRVLFDLLHDHVPLEDTLRSLQPADFLPERYPGSVAWRDLLFGVGVAGAAFVIPRAVPSSTLGAETVPATLVAGLGTVAGVVAYFTRTRHPEIPANVAENARRRAARDAVNAGVLARNNEKLAQTMLVLVPVVAAGLAR